jgi:hypothetical protein
MRPRVCASGLMFSLLTGYCCFLYSWFGGVVTTVGARSMNPTSERQLYVCIIDLAHGSSPSRLLNQIQPDEIYNARRAV